MELGRKEREGKEREKEGEEKMRILTFLKK